jgi:UDP-glucose 4-epimerase
MKLLVTGGTGFIGSHTVVELLNAGYEVTIIDNLSNSKVDVVDKIETITGLRPDFKKIDLRDYNKLEELFQKEKFEAVIHFAGLKAVGESTEKPLLYYENNVSGSINLFGLMNKYGVKNLIFSSSATVYGEPAKVPITEDFPTQPMNPYGETKLMIEQICRDLYSSDNSWNIVLLRYFNPVGCHSSGLIKEDPLGIPNNLFPFIMQVIDGRREYLNVFGDDYPTPDGTGVRDYIHVVDLALGHLKALETIEKLRGLRTYNLGTGKGYSVLEVIKAFEEINGVRVNHKIVARRQGDVSICYADSKKAEEELGWKANRGLEEMVVIPARVVVQNINR